MKPRINQTIYVLFKGEIFRQKVYMLGEESFIHDDAFNQCMIEEYRAPLYYDDYKRTWFLSSNEIDEEVVETEDGWYEIKK